MTIVLFGLDNQTYSSLLPSVDDVALLLRTRTVAGVQSTGLGADTGPQDVTTFTDTSRPSRTEVSRIIDLAAAAVLGSLPPLAALLTELDTLESQVKFAVTVQAAILVEGSFFREQAAAGTVAVWTSMLASTTAAINQSIINYVGASEETVGTVVVMRSPTAAAAAAYPGPYPLAGMPWWPGC